MKSKIHPAYHDAQVSCACGARFTVGSTAERLSVEICSACHPFYTGVEKIVDTAGRVEKFRARSAAARSIAESRSAKPKKPRRS